MKHRHTSSSEGRKAGETSTRKKQSKLITALSPEAHQNAPGSSERSRKPGAFVKNDPRINRTIPGPGRPPGRFAKKCRRLLNNKKTWRAVRRVVQNPDNPAMKGLWSAVADRGHGRPTSEVSLQLPQGTDDEGNQTQSAVLVLIGKMDVMEKRKKKAQESQTT